MLAQLRTELAGVADDVDGWTAYDHEPGDLHLPAFVVTGPRRILFHRDYSAGREVDIAVDLTVPRARELDAQRALDDAVDTFSALLFDAESGMWDSIEVVEAGPYRGVDLAAGPALRSTLVLTITT